MDDFLLSIAGFDPTGGAGILRDCMVFVRFGKKGRAVITSIVIQDGRRVKKRVDVEGNIVKRQLIEATRYGRLRGVKVGVIGNLEIAKIIFNFLKKIKQSKIHIVVDPVLASSDGFPLLDKNAYQFLVKNIFPLATVITPNFNEALILSGKDNVEEAGRVLSSLSDYVVITAGKEMGADFVFKNGKIIKVIKGNVYNSDIHGSGCLHSSSMLVFLSEGADVIKASVKAKREVEKEIKETL